MDFVRNLEECLILAFEMNTSCLDYSNQTINQLSNKNQWRGGSPPPNGYQRDIMSNLKLIRKITTREELMNALATGDKVTIIPNYPNEQMTGTIQSVEREDGSGYSFNVGIYVNNYAELKTVYIRFSA